MLLQSIVVPEALGVANVTPFLVVPLVVGLVVGPLVVALVVPLAVVLIVNFVVALTVVPGFLVVAFVVTYRG